MPSCAAPHIEELFATATATAVPQGPFGDGCDARRGRPAFPFTVRFRPRPAPEG